MRDAAANLEFEEAARIRDEIKRLNEAALAYADDPGTIKSRPGSAGRAGSGSAGSGGDSGAGPGGEPKTRARKNTLDEMTVGRTEKPKRRGPLPKRER